MPTPTSEIIAAAIQSLNKGAELLDDAANMADTLDQETALEQAGIAVLKIIFTLEIDPRMKR
jgi:hypothetical protein